MIYIDIVKTQRSSHGSRDVACAIAVHQGAFSRSSRSR
jgi:hypothetical protein